MEDVAPFEGVSLLAHVERLLPVAGRGPLVDRGEPLPDVGLLDKSQNRWMGGALDGVLSVRGSRSRGPEPLQATAAVLEVVRRRATTKSVHVAAERLDGLTSPSDADRLIEAVFADRRFDRGRLAEFSRWICRYGTHRGQVKAGIALLGACGNSTDVALITRLGLLEELTLYSLVALKKLGEPPEEAIFELGQQVTGWGRIHAIHRLKGTSSPVIQSWLLRGGYRNDVMVEEIAWIAATSGRLADALEGPIDEDLLDGAGIDLGGRKVLTPSIAFQFLVGGPSQIDEAPFTTVVVGKR